MYLYMKIVSDNLYFVREHKTSAIQAFLFSRDEYTKRDVHNFLRRNNIIPIKPIHTTQKYYRCRMIQPNYKKYQYKFGHISKGLDVIYQFLK